MGAKYSCYFKPWIIPCSSVGKEFACSAGDPGSIPGLGRSSGEGMATHSSILAWKISWTEEPGGFQSMGSQRVGHDWATNTHNRGIRDQITNICWIIEKAREFQKNIYFCFIDYAKSFTCVDHNKLWKILKEMGIPYHLGKVLDFQL